MLETLQKCPVCDSEDYKLVLETKDYSISKEKFNIVKCQNCDFVFTNPRPNESSIGKYYASEEYISHSNTKKGLINKIYHIVRKRALKSKLKLINSISKKGKILDAGCAVGAFLEVCQKDGWQVAGIEPDTNARNMAETKLGITIFNNIMDAKLVKESFQVITMWHVLEHIHQIHESLDKLSTALSSDGYMLIAVPNENAQEKNIFGKYWAAYDVPRHLYHFTPATLALLLDKHNLKITAQHPMYYDAYYVSLLSQRYKNGKANYFSAFMQGWKSNRWAKKNHNNYSSIIYQVNKK